MEEAYNLLFSFFLLWVVFQMVEVSYFHVYRSFGLNRIHFVYFEERRDQSFYFCLHLVSCFFICPEMIFAESFGLFMENPAEEEIKLLKETIQ